MHFVLAFGQGKQHLQSAASPRRRSFPCPHEMRGAGVFFLPRPLLAMAYQTTIKQPDGDITAIDVSSTAISNEQSEKIAQAVEMLMDGAEREASDTLRALASSIDGRDVEPEVERLRGAARVGLKMAKKCQDLEERHEPRMDGSAWPDTLDAIDGIEDALDAAEDGGDE